MATTPDVGQLKVPVVADLTPFKRAAKTELKRAAEEAGREAGAAQARAMGRDSIALLRKEGAEAARAFVDGLRRRMQRDVADAKEALFRGLIDRREYDRRAREAAKTFNDGILKEIERRAAQGQLTATLHHSLVEELRDVGLDAGESMSGGIRERLSTLPRWVRGVFAAGLLGAFVYVTGQVVRLFRAIGGQIRDTLTAAGESARIRGAFGNIAASRDVDSTAVLRELRQAMRGTVTDLRLMTAANVALQSGLPATAQEMGELAYIARRLGEAVGRDATESFERLVNGLAKGEQQILEELGLLTRMQTALRAWEVQTGQNSDALSQQEKILIFYNAVLDEAREKVQGMGEDSLDAGHRVDQLATFWANLKDATMVAVAESPRIVSFLESIGVGAENASERVQELADRIGAFVDAYGGSILGSLVGGAAGAGLGALFLGPPGLLVGGAVGLFGGSAMGQFFDRETYDEALRRRQQEREERGRRPPGQDGGPTPPSIETIRAAEDAAKELAASMREFQLAGELGLRDLADASDDVRAALRELLVVQQQIEETERRIAAIRAAGQSLPEGAEEYLAYLYRLRDAGREAADTLIQKWQRELPEVVVELQRSIVDSGVVPTITRLTQEVADAERELQIARLAQDPDRIARGEKRLADARKALREHVAEVVKGLEESGVKGESLTVVIERLVELLREAGVEVEAQDEGWSKHVRTLEGVARGVMSVANAMGVLNNETRQVLQGVIDIAGGIRQISSGNVIGGAAQAIGGVVGLFSGLFASGPDAQERARMVDEMVRLRQALAQLREAVLRDVTAQERSAMEMGGSRLFSARDIVRGMRRVFRGKTDLELLERLGFDQADTMELIRQLEAATGISLWNDRDSTIIWDNLEAALANLPEIGVWGDNLAGQLDALDWVFRMLGDDAGTAAERLERFLAVLRGFEGAEGFADEFARIMAEGGSEAAQAWLNGLAEQFARDPSSLLGEGGIFYGLTPEEVLRILERSGDFLGGPGGIVAGGTPETRLGVSITEVQADRLLAIESSQLYHLAAIHALIAGGAMPDASMSQIAPPSASAMAGVLGRMQGGDVNVAGGIEVNVNLPGVAAIDRGALAEIGAAARDGTREALDGLRAAYRGRGAQGPVHVRVDAGGVR